MAARKPTADLQLKEHIANESSRLDRIESKIDKLAETMISLARAEEKLISLDSDRFQMNERLNRHSEKLDTVEVKVEKNTITLSVITKIFWISLTAIAGAAAVQYLMVG
jgi:DNA repair exonuclease SbcCD ATPase subunit